MFCPNCAAQNDITLHYCRACGLKLDTIAENVSSQRPSAEFAHVLDRLRRFEFLGVACLSVAGFIGLSIVVAAIFYYKMQWVGPQVLFGSASIALVVFTVLSAIFLSYPKFALKRSRLSMPSSNPPKNEVEAITTNKLIDDRPFEPVPSVTEHSTELLSERRSR